MTLEKLKELRDNAVGMLGVDGLLEDDVLEIMDELIVLKEVQRADGSDAPDSSLL